MDTSRSKGTGSKFLQFRRRHGLEGQWGVLRDWLKAARRDSLRWMRRSYRDMRFRVQDVRAETAFVWRRARHPTRTRVWEQARFRVQDVRAETAFAWRRARHPTRTRVWEQARHPTLSQVLTLIIAGLGVVSVIGLLQAVDGPSLPSLLGRAFTVEVSDAGVPYIAIDPDALGEAEGEGGPTQADGGGPDGKGGSTPILLFPISDELFTFNGGDPPPGIHPPPSPNPEPSPGPGPTPSPSPGPSPSPTPGPSPTPNPAPSPEPSPTPETTTPPPTETTTPPPAETTTPPPAETTTPPPTETTTPPPTETTADLLSGP